MLAGIRYAPLLLNFHPVPIISIKVCEVKIVFIFFSFMVPCIIYQ